MTLFTFLPVQSARAQVPFFTDDSDTTEKGKFHLEFYNQHDILQKSSFPARRQNTNGLTLNYGLTDRLELGITAPLISIVNDKQSGQGIIAGLGDAQIAAKYRLRDETEGSRLPAITTVFYIELPTGNAKRQLGSGLTDFGFYGVVQKSLSEKTKVRFNSGLQRTSVSSSDIGGVRKFRGQAFSASSSIVRDFTNKLKLGVEVFGVVGSKPVLGRGQLTAQFGGNYSLNERFTLTFGVQGGQFTASPRIGLHVGFTYDF